MEFPQLDDGCFHFVNSIGRKERVHFDCQTLVMTFTVPYFMDPDLKLIFLSCLVPNVFGVGIYFPNLEGRIPNLLLAKKMVKAFGRTILILIVKKQRPIVVSEHDSHIIVVAIFMDTY